MIMLLSVQQYLEIVGLIDDKLTFELYVDAVCRAAHQHVGLLLS